MTTTRALEAAAAFNAVAHLTDTPLRAMRLAILRNELELHNVDELEQLRQLAPFVGDAAARAVLTDELVGATEEAAAATSSTPATAQILELETAARAAAVGRTPEGVDAGDTAFFVGYLVSALVGLTTARDDYDRLHAARAIAVYVTVNDGAEIAFSGLTERQRAELLNLFGRVERGMVGA